MGTHPIFESDFDCLTAMSFVVESLLDFNKVRKFQELCGIRECKDDDPRGEDAVVRESDPERKTKQHSAKFRATNAFLHNFFLLGSVFGTEVFCITYLPIIFWVFEHFTGRRLIQIWVVTMYLGQVLKEILQMSRPTSPTAFPMEHQHRAEFGFPSTHTIAAASLSFGTLWCVSERYDINIAIGVLVAFSFTLWVSLSRVYKGMHSFLDIVGGLLISGLYITLGWRYLSQVEDTIINQSFSPILCFIANFVLGWFYPNNDCPSRKDTVIILGVGAGINIASWLNAKMGYDYDLYAAPEAHIAFFRILHGIILVGIVRELAKTYVKKLLTYLTGPITEHNIRKRNVEVPLNYLVYVVIGITCTFVAPIMFTKLGLYR